MSERGVFAVDRAIFDHPKFKGPREEYTRLEAWLWLLAAAAWKEHTRWISGRPLVVARGQVVAATRTMAKQWCWSEAKVRRFLDVLKTDALGDAEIDAATDAGITVITIRKYDEYQRVSLPRDAVIDAAPDAETDATATQQRRIKEDIKNIKHTPARARRAPASEGRFPEFWAEYPRREGSNPRKEALRVYQQALKSGADEQAIIDGAKRYRADLRSRGQEGSRFVAQAVTWLRQCRWEDDLPNVALGSAATPNFATGGLPVDWHKWMRGYMLLPAYSRSWYGPGGEPGRPGCEVPCSILREYGIEPVPWVRRSDGKKFGMDENGVQDEQPRQAVG
ncbi:hypothetical protein [Bradyrhizobium elkanii]|uniref:hypothetical protein n=1 Tax=Bradyrhizobium elkanii TaxID=29448 RepID=UPI00271528CD|nr:hypothetical protein [Bradyrhizobium elkanii]WLA50727.1 hypothetical protein QIH80_11430 [Bradyrhizobium elkanii]WLB79035.1 hypothetical protein QIH83_32585 [Bradyrhizobium elkanii]